MTIDPGTIIDDRYRIVRELGAGGMGTVFEGVHTRIGRRVAIKVLHARFSKSHEVTARFHREAQAATSIGHPHIVDVTDFGQLEDGAPYMVLEFLDGRDWAADLKHEGPQPLDKTPLSSHGTLALTGRADAHGQGRHGLGCSNWPGAPPGRWFG